ncbi:serine hydrolase [Alkaliphilus pronyensis]|uniref:Serine hydrolase n=1 Tax=Alkaliphilus pronyensis TaxID=1482732 RepID=A0A6I0FCF2_9FIRM|nr:serine hydrolase [Alkaliphilus pronyensis]KAB3535430.1 serine hydrolase [Alkaliphilus pronyensis]
MLRETVLNKLQGVEANVSIVLNDLTRDKWVLRYKENKKFPSASTIKILIMVEALKQVNEGKFTLEQKITAKDSDRVEFSIISELNISEYTFKDLIILMIIISDNTATNMLIDMVGYESINKMAGVLGLSSTVLKRKMMDFEAAKAGRQNETSAIDMAKILQKIYNKSILNEEMCEIMIDILKRQKHKDSLSRYITDEVTIAHKTGELDRLNHDIGIFYLEDIHYILGVFVTDAQDNLEAKRIIGSISKLVYEHFLHKGR